MFNHTTFLHLLFTGLIALFPVVNPVGSALIVNPYFVHLDRRQKNKAVKKIALYSFSICAVALFAGHWILELFGLTIPVVKIAGGIMICKMGWEFLSNNDDDIDEKDVDLGEQNESYHLIEKKLFYPLTFPVTTGSGTISVLFTLSANSADKDMTTHLINTSAILLAVMIMCMMVYLFYRNTKNVIHLLGSNGESIFNKISAFLIFAVGLQIVISGIISILKINF
ncbi:MAG TPA: MarC family protein [Mucilaginibacter sp.]|jgi:multiple antibiotic resistance protein